MASSLANILCSTRPISSMTSIHCEAQMKSGLACPTLALLFTAFKAAN